MSDFLAQSYPWIKAFHIMAVIAWMAGLFYMPRLFVYHTEQVGQDGVTHEMFLTMERRLFNAIMTPAMIATWVLGLCLVFTPGLIDWSDTWPWIKGVSVLSMSAFHDWLGRRRKDFMRTENKLTGRQYRMMNEVPTLLMVVIVLSVVLKF